MFTDGLTEGAHDVIIEFPIGTSMNENFRATVPISAKEMKRIGNLPGDSTALKNSKYQIYIRSAGVRGKMTTDKLSHGCGVKLAVDGKFICEIPVPGVQIDKAKKPREDKEGVITIEEFSRSSKVNGVKIDSKTRSAITNFLYDNQMLLRLYWNSGSDPALISILKRYIKEQLIHIDYYSVNMTFKKEKDLSEDCRKIEKYVNDMSGPSIHKLNFK